MYDIKQVQREYRNKLISAEFAAGLVKSNDRLHLGVGTGTSQYFDKALGERLKHDSLLRGLVIQTELAIRRDYLETYKATKSVDIARFHSSYFLTKERKMAEEGNSWYIPMLFNEEGLYWDQEGNHFDICCIQVAPMDRYGNFNFGPTNADLRGIIKSSKTVIVEVNDNMPIALGYDSHINISDVNYIIEGEGEPLFEMLMPEPSYADRRIAEYIVERIRNGSTLQLGIGSIPNAVGKMLAETELRDLGCHTELLCDAYMNLYYAGKLTNDKAAHKGLSVYSIAAGSKELYDFIDDNPICYCAPVDMVNNIHTVGNINNFISIDSCYAVDLFGQASSESVGPKQIGGSGGQLDYALGAFLSKGGRSFICTHSTKTLKDGTLVSNIHPTFEPGTVVTTPRAAVHYIVTEYGAANLKGKSTWQRAEMLINIAHPKFREQLVAEAEKMGIWHRTSKIEFL